MVRKFSLLMTGAALGVMGALAVNQIGTISTNAVAAGTETYRQLDIFGDIFERVRSQYVKEPKEEKLIKDAINGMLQSLDPHSSYLDPKDATVMREQTSGKFGGLGIEVTMENDLVKVITPIADTPAEKAGIIAGDLVSQIDGDNVRGLSLQQAVEKMRGLVNTPIVLTVLRKGADKPLKITIVRAIITVKSVKFRVDGDDVGYIDMNGFTEQTYSGMEAAIKNIRAQVPDDRTTSLRAMC